MELAQGKTSFLKQPIAIACLLAAFKIILYILAGSNYGYFRDELYYLACADHLAWGYVDHPPLSIAVLHLWRAAFGSSLVAIRLFPALAEAAVVYVTVRTARALGARTPFAALAGFAVLAGPAFFAFGHFFSMNAIDHLVWAIAGWL